MTQQATFTARASRDCQRIRVDEDEARDVVDDPDHFREWPDPGDPDTVFVYSVRTLSEDRALVVTWRQLADRRLVYRVSLLHPSEFD
jgi:hypothetical protein